MTVFHHFSKETKYSSFSEVSQPAILVTPLDWGLGHATRCIPIIRSLLSLNEPVLLGGCGDSLEVLKLEFPNLPFVEFPVYNMRYPKENMVWNLAIKLPQLLTTFVKEQHVIKTLVRENRIKAIISDNRYGCYHPDIPSILITHQVYPISPVPSLEKRFQKYVQHLINQFDSCWIPDLPDLNQSLAGKLAHPTIEKATFVGPLSRLFPIEPVFPRSFQALFLLSGPEPQRTHLENKIKEQVKGLKGDFILVQGLPNHADKNEYKDGNLIIFPYLEAEKLSKIIAESEIVLCRAGYSTLMDLSFFGKKAIYVPTPGQTEQIYLAAQLNESNTGYTVSQDKLNLKEALDKAKKSKGLPLYDTNLGNDLLAKAINKLLVMCQK